MTVQAVFYVKSVNHMHTGTDSVAVEITLGAAFGGYLKGLADDNVANKEWSKYTPSGELKMMVTNPAAIEQFSPGDVFSLTFEKLDQKSDI